MGKDLSFPTNHVRIILAQQKGCLLHEIICISKEFTQYDHIHYQ